MNGRKLLNESEGQPELIGEEYIQSEAVNPNIIPIEALSKVIIYSPGSSIKYGDIGSSGVVNNIFKKKF